MTSWAKLHTSIYGDPKLMRACREGHQALAYVPWLFAFAKRANDGGRLSVGAVAADSEDLANGIPDIQATPAKLAQCATSCLAIGVLTEDPDGVLRFVRWDDRQGKPTESREAWRTRKQRQRSRQKQQKKEAQNKDVTPRHDKRSRGTNRDRSHLSRLQTETETETRSTGELGTTPSGLSPSKGDASDAPVEAAGALTAPPPVIPMSAEEIAMRDRLRAEAHALKTREPEGASA